MSFIANHQNQLILAMGITCCILCLVIFYLLYAMSGLKQRYRTMMTGDLTGRDFEAMLMEHIKKTDFVHDDNQAIHRELADIAELLSRAVTRVGVVRFSAFADTGSDLSYAVALLDAHNDGVVLSSIFGREDSRSYVKPIRDCASTYTLTQEEIEAINAARGR